MLTVECVRIPLQWWVYLYQYTPAEEGRKEERDQANHRKVPVLSQNTTEGAVISVVDEREREGGEMGAPKRFHFTELGRLDWRPNRIK